jgi:hypothetical protein
MNILQRSFALCICTLLLCSNGYGSGNTVPLSLRMQGVMSSSPTFSADIAPIIWKNCVSCHRSGEVAPFTLTSYNDVASRGEMIKYVTASRYMPPWKPADNYGSFADHRGLTQNEIDMIAQWVDSGKPIGNEADIPALPNFPNGSTLGTPDLVLKMPKSWHIKGDNKDMYRNFVLPTNLLENKKVAAIEFRPGNPKVVHHALIYLDTNKAAQALDAKDTAFGYDGFGGPGFTPVKNLLGYVPGQTPRFFPKDIGITLFKQSDVVVQIHYAPSVVEADDQSSINIFFAKDETPKYRELIQTTISPIDIGSPFIIPASQVRSFKGTINVPINVSLMLIAPHMHLLGRKAKSYAVTNKGDTIKLLRVDDWDFKWQGFYAMKNLVKIPAGSKLYYEAEYDNTVNNPLNPSNPPKITRWGESTYDEMFLNYFLFIPYRDGDESISLETQTPTSVQDANPVYSSSVAIQNIYPNPSVNSLSVQYSTFNNTKVQIEVFDLLGSTVLRSEETSNAGVNYTNFSTAGLTDGVYMLKINSNNSTVVSMFTVRK